MVHFGEPVFDAVLVADPVEDVVERIFATGVVGELDAVVRQHRVDGAGDRRDQIAQELRRNWAAIILPAFWWSSA